MINKAKELILNEDIDLNISSIKVHDPDVKLGMSFAGISNASLITMLDSSLKTKIAAVVQALGDGIIAAEKVQVVDLAPADGITPTSELLAKNLPQTLGVKLMDISSDADGKYLLLIGDIRVEETVTPAESMKDAIYSFILCDSNAFDDTQPESESNVNYCKEPAPAP